MDYRNAAQAQSTLSGAAPKAIEKPRIAMQLDQMEKVLSECHQIAANVEDSANRILGPLPEDASKNVGRPPAASLDQRFAELISVAEGLAHRLGAAASRLNSAV